MTETVSLLPTEFDTLLEAAKAGEQWAWTELFRDLAPPVFGYLRVRGAWDPDDVAGEVFLRVARGLVTFEGDERSFRSWVFTITRRLLFDESRRLGRRPRTTSVDVVTEHRSERAWLSPGPDEQAERSWDAESAVALVGRLTRDQREVVSLRILGGFSIDEVAEIVGKEPNAVKQLQHRGVAALRRLVAQPDAVRPDGLRRDEVRRDDFRPRNLSRP
jgi:RNA polymerase sigma-70 factor (ECF subfamily)